MQSPGHFAVEAWENLSQFLRTTNVDISQHTASEVLGNLFVVPLYLTNTRQEEEMHGDDGFNTRLNLLDAHIQYSENNAATQNHDLETCQFLISVVEWTRGRMEWLYAELKMNRLCPPDREQEVEMAENTCMVIIYTLLRDGWHENRRCTRMRNSNVQHVYILWSLVLLYRLYRRQGRMDENRKYKGSHFVDYVTVPEFSGEMSILNFEPWRLNQALTLADTCYMRDLGLYDERQMSMVFLYRELLLDRCALIAHYRLKGTSEELVQSSVVWIHKENTTAFGKKADTEKEKEKEKEAAPPLMQYIDSDVLRRLEAEKEKRERARAEEGIYNPETEKKAKRRVVTVREQVQEYTKNQFAHELENMKGTLKTLTELKSKYDTTLKKSASSMASNGINITPVGLSESINRNAQNILNVKSLIHELEYVSKKEITEEEEARIARIRQETLDNILREGHHTYHVQEDVYSVTLSWYKDNVYNAVSLFRWQRLFMDAEAIGSVQIFELRNALAAAALQCIQTMDPTRLAGDVKDWIIRMDTPCCRRELYRARVNYKPSFNLTSAWKQFHPDITAEMDRFPTSIEDYLNKHNPYHWYAMAYIGYNYLIQIFPARELDTSFFYWDIDDECLSLERKTITHPVMCKVGANWCVYTPPLLGPESDLFMDDETGYLRVRTAGHDFFACLAQFCFVLNDRNWKIFERKDSSEINLRNSKLEIETKRILAKQRDELLE